MLENDVAILQIRAMAAITTLMAKLNVWAHWLQRVVDVCQPHVQKRYHEKEGLTLLTGKMFTCYPAMECECLVWPGRRTGLHSCLGLRLLCETLIAG